MSLLTYNEQGQTQQNKKNALISRALFYKNRDSNASTNIHNRNLFQGTKYNHILMLFHRDVVVYLLPRNMKCNFIYITCEYQSQG